MYPYFVDTSLIIVTDPKQAYCMPLISRLIFKHFTPGVWYMGDKLSYASALYSVLWMTFIFILLLFPVYPGPNAQQMNYAVAVLGFVLVFCFVYYYIPGLGGKTFFTGPVRTIDDIIGTNPELEMDLEREVLEDKAKDEGEKGVFEGN